MIERSEAGEEGEGFRAGQSVRDGFNGFKFINHCNLISKPKVADIRRGRAAAAYDSNWGAFEPDRGCFEAGPGLHLNRPGQAPGNK